MDPQVTSGFGEALPSSAAPATSGDVAAVSNDPAPEMPAAPVAELPAETEAHAAAGEPLAITPEIQPEPAVPVTPDVARDAKAS